VNRIALFLILTTGACAQAEHPHFRVLGANGDASTIGVDATGQSYLNGAKVEALKLIPADSPQHQASVEIGRISTSEATLGSWSYVWGDAEGGYDSVTVPLRDEGNLVAVEAKLVDGEVLAMKMEEFPAGGALLTDNPPSTDARSRRSLADYGRHYGFSKAHVMLRSSNGPPLHVCLWVEGGVVKTESIK
jgi:hypothetical protein